MLRASRMAESVHEKSHLSGARGDFVASLGRRLQALRTALQALEQQPASRARREALLRRAHALGASARVLGFASVAEALAEAERAVARVKQATRPGDLAEVSRVLDVVPSLVGGASASLRPPKPLPGALASRQWPLSLLLFGGSDLELQLTQAVQSEGMEFERSEDVEHAAQMARVLGPDLVILDADAPKAVEFFRLLSADELTEPVRSIFIGQFADAEALRQLTLLGASRVLRKPVGADTLRRTIEELTDDTRGTPEQEAFLGDLTIRGLRDRIGRELDRGLLDAALPGTQATRVSFDDGADVLATVWGTITRVRELVTLRSQGAVRFESTGPEGAIPLAPWIDLNRRAGERGHSPQRDEQGVSLAGRKVVVADDDPAITWFLSGLLETVGADVMEVYDGVRALELVHSQWPDLVVSDILMPRLDGFALCREIKRDIAVRDVPVILLSWKEDLLQRLRELGAAADGYMRKEAEASTVVQRIREVMRPRARVEARLAQGGEVRGRLDGLTPRLVLELCCKSEEDLRLEVRDAIFTYSVQVRRGRLVSAQRRGSAVVRPGAEAALASLLGVSAGRFLVAPDDSPCPHELDGDLASVLGPAIAHARRCQAALSYLNLPKVERIELVHDELESYLSVSPEPVRTLLHELDAGRGPSELLVSGMAPAELVIHSLEDLARRGIIARVVGPELDQGDVAGLESDNLPAAPEAEPAESAPANPAFAASETMGMQRPPSVEDREPESLEPARPDSIDEKPTVEPEMNQVDPSKPNQEPGFSFQLSPEAPRTSTEGRPRQQPSDAPSFAEAALDDAAWFTSALAEPTTEEFTSGAELPSEITEVEPSRAEVSEAPTRTPPAVATAPSDPTDNHSDPLGTTLADAPPESHPATLAGTPVSGHRIADLLTATPHPQAAPEGQPAAPSPGANAPARLLPRTKTIAFPTGRALVSQDAPAEAKGLLVSEEIDPGAHLVEPPSVGGEAPLAARAELAPERAATENAPANLLETEAPQLAEPAGNGGEGIPSSSTRSGASRERGPEAAASDETPAGVEQVAVAQRADSPQPVEGPRKSARASAESASVFKVIGYALVAMVFSYLGMSALVGWFTDPASEQAVTDTPKAAEPAATLATPAGSTTAVPASPVVQKQKTESKPAPAQPSIAITETPIPAGLALGADKGVLKIATPDAHTIYVDGEFAGRGPIRIVPLSPGKHSVKTRFEGEEHAFSADVKAGRMTRLSIAGAQ